MFFDEQPECRYNFLTKLKLHSVHTILTMQTKMNITGLSGHINRVKL